MNWKVWVWLIKHSNLIIVETNNCKWNDVCETEFYKIDNYHNREYRFKSWKTSARNLNFTQIIGSSNFNVKLSNFAKETPWQSGEKLDRLLNFDLIKHYVRTKMFSAELNGSQHCFFNFARRCDSTYQGPHVERYFGVILARKIDRFLSLSGWKTTLYIGNWLSFRAPCAPPVAREANGRSIATPT